MASTRIHNSINSRHYRGALWLVMVLALFLGDSWAACHSYSGYEGFITSQRQSCQYGSGCDNGGTCKNAVQCQFSCPDYRIVSNKYYTNYVLTKPAECDQPPSTSGCSSSGGSVSNCVARTYCDTKCDADSLACVGKGFIWNSADCICDDPSVCAVDKSACENFGGKWSGGSAPDGNGGTCCMSHCNTCGSPSFQDITLQKIEICCKQGFAPPEDTAMCAPFNVIIEQGCGMSTSKINVNTGAFTCYAPNDAETIERYNRMCFSSSSSDDGSSSSGGDDGSSSSGDGGSSSSGGGSSNSQYPEGCPECPWLDSILDTLTRQKWIVQDIYDCLLMPYICGIDNQNERDTIDFALDTGLIHIVFKPYMDSSLKLDSGQVRELIKIDSSLRYIIRLDSALLKSDSVTRKAIIGGLLGNDSTVDALNDSTRKWLRRIADSLRVYNDSNRLYLGYIADSIGISVDSLITHIDSIKNSIPKDVLDSILKYQKQFAESRDSIIVDGLPALDSMIDSSLKYWKLGLHYDSIYHKNYADSLGSIHDAISGIGNGVGYALGYGDTASSTLRKDLSNIIDALGGGGTISAFDSAVAANGGGVVDTSGVHLDIYGGELLADSIAHDIGYGKIDVARDTADLNAALSAGYEETDSTLCVGSECVSYDSDSKIADSAQRYIARQGDSIRASNQAFYKDSVDSYFQQIKDTLSKLNPFGMFDSTLMKTLGAKVPNSNTCPEHCSKYRVDIPFIFANLGIDLDWQLCASWAVLGGQNVMSFLRFIIRVVVAVTCISMIMHAAANTKLK